MFRIGGFIFHLNTIPLNIHEALLSGILQVKSIVTAPSQRYLMRFYNINLFEATVIEQV